MTFVRQVRKLRASVFHARPSRWTGIHAASDNVTHGTWILAAVALGVLSVGALGLPGEPVHRWFHCNIDSITDISSTRSVNACGGLTVTAFTPDDGSVTTSTVFTVTGTHLPIYSDSAGSAGSGGGYDFPNFLLMSDNGGTTNGWGNNSLVPSPGAWGVTILSSSSTELTFSITSTTDANAVPLEIFLSTHPITAGEVPSAGDGTTGAP